MRYLQISVRNGFIWAGLGVLLLLIGMYIAMGDVGTRENPLSGAVGVAAILVAITMMVWGVAQILAAWGKVRDDDSY